MGFPSPAADYVATCLSLDKRLIHKPAATYYMRASETIYRYVIMKDALLVDDASLTPCDGSLVVLIHDSAELMKESMSALQTLMTDLFDYLKDYIFAERFFLIVMPRKNKFRYWLCHRLES